MGQGIYTMIGYGAANVKLPVKNDGYVMELHEVFGFSLAESLRQNYECEPSYLLVPLAVSDHCLANWWQIECFQRQAFTLDELRSQFEDGIFDAHQIWKRATKEAKKKCGFALPLGELLVVCDFD